ncbi:MAG TPA: ABC transporter ATP-binding protein [Firmicutes bacterium]|nr:ABC transporter ATP-binding protein [Bacillota bacterium]
MNSPLLQIKRLKKYFLRQQAFWQKWAGKKEYIYAVDGVSFSVNKGETLGLVGESGCGKSTLGRTILRLYEPTAGEIYFDGEKINHLQGDDLLQLRRRMQIIFQDPFASLNPRQTVERIIGLPLRIQGMKGRELSERVDELLEQVGLGRVYRKRFPHQFSGGQRQRIGIARALAVNPSFVVADEPVSALDVSIQAQIINLLEELQEKMGLTYLFIAHDLSVVSYVSDRIVVMYLGRVVEMGPTEEIFSSPQHPYTKALLSSIPRIGKKDQSSSRIILEGSVPSPLAPPAGCRFNTRCFVKNKPAACFHETPPLVQGAPGHYAACHLLG